MQNSPELLQKEEPRIEADIAHIDQYPLEVNLERKVEGDLETKDKDTRNEIEKLHEDLHAEQKNESPETSGEPINITTETYSKKGNDIVRSTGEYEMSLEELWSRAKSPMLFSEDTSGLSLYKIYKNNPDGTRGEQIKSTDPIETGYHIEEVHTFPPSSRFSLPQRYEGKITQVVPLKKWRMKTDAVGLSKVLFSLPHDVEYSFEGDEHSSKMTIMAVFQSKGLLSLVRGKALDDMQKAVEELLQVPLKKEVE
jgi:hypothetical protein